MGLTIFQGTTGETLLIFFKLMSKINLKAKSRQETGKKVKAFRKKGIIPAVIYGSGKKPRNLWLDIKEFRKVYEKAGESSILDLKVDDQKPLSVLVYDAQMDPLTYDFSHVDLFQFRMDEKIETEVPLEFIGEAPAVKESGGVLIRSVEEISVRCLPGDLPSKFIVDLSVLKTFDDYIRVKDLLVGKGVEIDMESETIIASVNEPRSEEDLAKLDEKIDEDVSKVEGVAEKTEEPAAQEDKENKEDKKE